MRLLLTIIVALVTAACSVDTPSTDRQVPSAVTGDAPPASSVPSFVNKVWIVAESQQVAPGELRVFLSNGTLVMASSAHTSTPAFGTWSYNDGRLTITEEGSTYNVDILELTDHTFRIRIHGPGEPVVIRFTPAP